MSNRIDFFQSNQALQTIPACTFSVLLDGMLCPWLEPIEIVRSGWPEFSWARLEYNPALYPEANIKEVQEIEHILASGKSVCIRQVYTNSIPGASVLNFPIFAGIINGSEKELTSNGEKTTIVVRDCSAELRCITLYGQRVRNTDGSVLFLKGANTVFNKGGEANAAAEPIENNGHSYTAFAPETHQGMFWNYWQVIDYLLCEYLSASRLHRPTIEQLQSLAGKKSVYDLDVTGLNFLQALYRCCEHIGLKFKFVPRYVSAGPMQAIVFYRNAKGRTIELNCQASGENFDFSKTNIFEFHSIKESFQVTHKYIGQGDFKVYEATFNLIKAWDPADESTDYGQFSPSTNPEFNLVKDVYRKWCLNEAGDYIGAPYNQGNTFDFYKIFGGADFARRRRRFWPALTTANGGKSLGYFLQISYDNGLHWWRYCYAFDILSDECGLWLSSDKFDVEMWVAALKGTLKFRITASVISDERLCCEVAEGPVGSISPVTEKVFTLPSRFRYRKVTSQSIFSNLSDESVGQPDEVDDSEGLYEFIRYKMLEDSDAAEVTEVKTPCLVFDYRIGDRVVASPESWDVLNIRADNRSISWVDRVHMDFQKQCTSLKIVRQRNLLL